jgi:hypothetical protein
MDRSDDDVDYNKLSLVIRKPQEGKTFICTNIICNDRSNAIHIVLTMNTLSAGMQFFGRMEEEINPNQIIVFNSDRNTAGKCHHAKNEIEVLNLIERYNIKVIVCCAHINKIRKNLPIILKFSKVFGSIFKIHIDEAHKYIPANRKEIGIYNEFDNVISIIGYTGTPNKIWVDEIKNSNDKLFHRMKIIDIEKELQIIRSPYYYGVVDCNRIIYNSKMIENETFEENISDLTLIRAGGITSSNKRLWYNEKFPFSNGNEIELFKYIKFILPLLNISNDSFSYNFIPAYNRKATHYEMMKIILEKYFNANVIIINGNGIEHWRNKPYTNKSWNVITAEELRYNADENENKRLLEPSYVIEKMINKFPNCPLFITGFTCVSMSVTLINKHLGNFNNVVFAHQHLNEDDIYQLCRFLFNYSNWDEKERTKIKPTTIHFLTQEVCDTILNYEKHIEKMTSSKFAGKVCTLREIQELSEKSEKTEDDVKEIKKKELNSITFTNKQLWKKFPVVDGNDKEQWYKVEEFYKEITGHNIIGKSMPNKKEDGFYYCSTTKGVKKNLKSDIKKMESHSWHSTFSQLLPNKLNYARIFVGYENIDDNTEYYIYVKYALIEDTEHNRNILEKYGENNNKNSAAAEDHNYDSTDTN